MSTPDASRAAFEHALPEMAAFTFVAVMNSAVRRPDGLYQQTAVEAAWRGWQASRKAALATCVTEIRGMKANHKVAQSAINQCAEALEHLK